MHSLQILSLIATVSAGTVSVPFSRAPLDQEPALAKRDTLTLDALNNITGGGYYGDFEVGTPGQNISFLLDTGSSDTWVNSVDADICSSKKDQANWGYCWNTFKPDASSTFEQSNAGGFQVKYLDGRNVQGDYFNDTITINGKAIKKQQLGLALNSSRATGIMGLGFKANVAAAVKYSTVLDNMVSQGLIETPVFSLYLNDLNANQGSILFGGIDQAKFYDKLVTLPMKNDFQAENQVTSFTISLQGLDVHGSKNYSFNTPIPNAILDSGSTVTLLPSSEAQPIHDLFGVITITGVRTPFIDCAWGGAKGQGYEFAFKFAGKSITVPMDEMVIDAFANVEEQIRNDSRYGQIFKDFSRICLFGIGNLNSVLNSRTDIAILGDTFLRSAYVVYDLKNEQIGLAQAKLNSTETNIVEIKASDKTIPNSERGAGGHATPAIVFTAFMALSAAMAQL